jgi:hypothetical protein
LIEVYEANDTDALFSLLRVELEEVSPAVFRDLHPFYLYELQVAAVTVGPGLFSDIITWRMPEDGMLCMMNVEVK